MASLAGGAALAKFRILVVEDEYFLANDMCEALERLGAKVIGPTPSVSEALRLLASEEGIDIGVLDINLQGEAVFPLADALAERGIPYVFATGYHTGAIPSQYADVPHWEKPFDPLQLASMLPAIGKPA